MLPSISHDFSETGARRPGAGRAWFLKMILCGSSVCVCPPPRLLITSGVMWGDMDSIRLVKQVLQLVVVVIVNGRGLGVDTRRRH